jgi:hypothetical protein
MNVLPEEVEMIIYRYVHELNFLEVRVQLEERCYDDMVKLFMYFQTRVFYPYSIIKRLGKSLNECIYWRTKIDKYIHYKLLSRCFKDINKN